MSTRTATGPHGDPAARLQAFAPWFRKRPAAVRSLRHHPHLRARNVKLPLYARAGIREVWIVNLPGGNVECHTDASSDGYRSLKRVRRNGLVRRATRRSSGRRRRARLIRRLAAQRNTGRRSAPRSVLVVELRPLGDRVEGTTQDLQPFVEFLVGDGERGEGADDVAVLAGGQEQQAFL